MAINEIIVRLQKMVMELEELRDNLMDLKK
jgi:hypothetical protein